MTELTPPVVILDKSQMAENIGAVARVMANFGLSELRLGILLGLVKGIPTQQVDRLLLDVQPAHLQASVGRTMGGEERDVERARRLRNELGRRSAKRMEKRTK